MVTRKRLLIGQDAAIVRENSIGGTAAELTDMIKETHFQLIVYMVVVVTCQKSINNGAAIWAYYARRLHVH